MLFEALIDYPWPEVAFCLWSRFWGKEGAQQRCSVARGGLPTVVKVLGQGMPLWAQRRWLRHAIFVYCGARSGSLLTVI